MATVAEIQQCSAEMASPAITKEEFSAIMQRVFGAITGRFIELCKIATSNAETQAEEQQICAAIAALRTNCLENFKKYFPALNSFGRDVFKVGDFTVEAAQFFDWEPYYEGDFSLLKLYRWSVYDSSRKIVSRFYLERSDLGMLYHVLGMQTPSSHAQIQPYGPHCPDYMTMKKGVVGHLQSLIDGSPTDIIAASSRTQDGISVQYNPNK